MSESEFSSMIPIGFHFNPTDEELIGGFLLARLMGEELPWNGIVEKQLYGENFPREPWKVFSDVDESSMYWHSKEEGGATKNTIYAFTALLRVPNSKRISRRAGCGTWGGQTGPKKIESSETGKIIGQSKMFAFEHPGEAAEADVGHWTMHEYSLSDEMVRLSGRANGADLVLCKITKTMKKKESDGKRAQQQLFSPVEIGYGGGGVDIPVAQPEIIYPEIGDWSGSMDIPVAQPELFYPEMGDCSGSMDIPVAHPELFYPEMGDCSGSMDIPVAQPELFYPEMGDCSGSMDIPVAQPELFYPEIGDCSGSIEIPVAQQELFHPEIGDCSGSIDIPITQPQWFFPAIGDGDSGGSIAQPELFYPVIGDGGGSDVPVAQPEFIYPAIGDCSSSFDQLFYPDIGDSGGSIEQLCYPVVGDGGNSIDIRVPAAAMASNKRAAEVDYPNEEDVEGGFKRRKKSNGDGEGLSDAAAVDSFLLGGDDVLPSGFDDNIDVVGLWGADFSFE